MNAVSDEEMMDRMLRLEATMPPTAPMPVARRRGRPRGWLLVASAALVLAFGGGAVARELVDHGWHDSGLFTPGGALYCTSLRNMVPSEAAPILKAMGYEVTWQIENGPGTKSYQTDIAPTAGYLDEGISKGRRMVILVDYQKQSPAHCDE